MKSNTCTEARPVAEMPAAESSEHEPTAGELDDLVACVRQADRLLARATTLAGRLAGSGICEEREGLPLEVFLALAARMTGADARLLVSAGQVLGDLPVTAELFRRGSLGWGQVRAIVSATRSLSRAARAAIDARVAATVEAHPAGAKAFDPEGLVWAVDAAADELRPKAAERAERRAEQRTFLTRQMDLDGRMRCYGEFDPLSAAAVNNALDAKMGRPPAGGGGATGAGSLGEHADDGTDGGAAGAWSSRGVGQAAARALVDVCADWLGGDSGRPARPLLVAHVDVSDTAVSPSGTVELNLRGPLPRIGAATLERLARDADLRAVLFDGSRPLAASRKIGLEDIPRKIRLAVAARDRGCRFPGSSDPIGFTDVDHLVQRAHGGHHHPDRLASISRRFHTIRHRHGWKLTLDPDTGMLTIQRGDRRFHSMPRGTRLARPPDQLPVAPLSATARLRGSTARGDPPLPF